MPDTGTKPAPDKQPEKSYESYTELISWAKQKLSFLVKFWNTRKAVLAGEPLYNIHQDELKKRGLLGPWTFNLYKTITPPGIYGAWIIVMRRAMEADATMALAAKVMGYLSPAIIPLSLVGPVFATAYACLPSGFVNRPNWEAAQRKYLYVDGAYGLWPQLLIALGAGGFARAILLDPNKTPGDFLLCWAVLGSLSMGIGLIWQGLLWYRIQNRLFEFDYLQDRETMFASLTEPSPFKFYLISSLAPMTAMFTFVAIFLLAFGIASVLEHVLPK